MDVPEPGLEELADAFMDVKPVGGSVFVRYDWQALGSHNTVAHSDF